MDKKLLEMLVCPLSKGTLTLDRENNELICKKSGIAYPIRNDIPIMLVEEARVFDEEKYEQSILMSS